jgi:demethylmenaquinone methyltransferase/2-methoxy-6-polyprenyl-1,4-benzoquinol methylase
VYGPIARQLVANSPHPLTGRVVLDVGAGTGVANAALRDAGARPVAVDTSYDMLAWQAHERPPAVAADVLALPCAVGSVDDTVAAFVLNHLVEPALGIAEIMRVTRPNGALLACVYANASRSEVRDALDQAAQREGWQVPEWYLEIKRQATPILGTAEDMGRVARQAGLVDIVVEERPVDVGVTEPEQLVDYRLGQAQFSAWLDQLAEERFEMARARLVETIRPVMCAYRPIVVFLSAVMPPS